MNPLGSPKRTACIVGFDGHDQCIGIMTASFYSMAGYATRLEITTPTPADLLVILRGEPPGDLEMMLARYGEVHVYGYVTKLSKLYSSILKGVQHKIIVPDPSYLPEGYLQEHGNASVVISFPAVIPDFWYVPRRAKTKLQAVHIGNYKANEDEVNANFVRHIVKSDVKVYGQGWRQVVRSKNYLGPLPMIDVSSIYSISEVGLGIMYPYQRGFTLSSRFFQAPLTGTPLLSEAIPLLSNCPGVFEIDYRQDDLFLKDFINSRDCVDLAENAYEYWRRSTINLANKIELDLLNRLSMASSFFSGTEILRNANL